MVQREPDGGIIVVGDAPLPEDMMVARYNANGNLDLTFGEGGFRLFDFNLSAELAESVAVQSNGAIVLSGPHTKAGEAVREYTAVVRLDPGRDPDATFGTDGVLILDGTRVSDGLAIHSDGRIVLVEDIGGPTPNAPLFSTMRLNSNGTPDSSFGNAGRVNTAITTRGDQAQAVALQAGRQGRGRRSQLEPYESELRSRALQRERHAGRELRHGQHDHGRLLRPYEHHRERGHRTGGARSC